MKLHVGTSGYSYPEWKGTFYPERIAAPDMLAYYAERLPAVEINNTFYRLPRATVLAGWAEQVPDGFRFALKASRRITHARRLRGAEDEAGYLFRTVAALGDRLGALLFQLPAQIRKDLPRLEAFLSLIPPEVRAAFEFRHASWEDDEVAGLLAAHGAARCLGDEDTEAGGPDPGWGYLRLRRPGYNDGELRDRLEWIRARGWDETFCFFKHEEAGAGPALARRFLDLAGPA